MPSVVGLSKEFFKKGEPDLSFLSFVYLLCQVRQKPFFVSDEKCKFPAFAQYWQRPKKREKEKCSHFHKSDSVERGGVLVARFSLERQRLIRG